MQYLLEGDNIMSEDLHIIAGHRGFLFVELATALSAVAYCFTFRPVPLFISGCLGAAVFCTCGGILCSVHTKKQCCIRMWDCESTCWFHYEWIESVEKWGTGSAQDGFLGDV